jgi:hypothetical protein
MVNIYQLDLPDPSFELMQTAKNIMANTVLDHDGKIWLDQKNSIDNSAEHLFFAPDKIDQMVQAEFGHLFEHEIKGMMAIFKNTHVTHSTIPPHIDRRKSMAINYYLDLGGSNVQTCFYEPVSAIDLDQAQHFTYKEVEKQCVGSIKFENNRWYAFNVNRCHSIENITGTRYFLAIYFKKDTHQYNVKNLENDYPNLIKNRFVLDPNVKDVGLE